MSYFSSFIVLYFNAVHLELFFLHCIIFNFFIRERINHTCIPTSLTFLVSKMGLTTSLGQLVSKRKTVEEGVKKQQNPLSWILHPPVKIPSEEN